MVFHGMNFVVLMLMLSVDSDNGDSEIENDMKFERAKGYNKHNPPPPENGTAVEVEMRIFVREVARIDEMNSAVSVFFNLYISWADSRVLLKDKNFVFTYENLNMLVLKQDQIKDYWKPDIYVENMINYKVKEFYEDLVLMRILYKDNRTRVSFLELAELEFKCVMDFSMYPFDVHACPIIFKSFSYTVKELILKWGKPYKMEYSPRNSKVWNKIPLYSIEMEFANSYCEYTDKEKACLAIIMIVTREIEYHVFQTYIPSGGFVLISWISFIVTPEAVPGRMVLLVTTLLTLITMYNSVRSSTPPSAGSSLKAIEVWLSTCITFVFSALMEYAAVLSTRIVVINRINNQSLMTEIDDVTKSNGNKKITLKPRKISENVPDVNLVNNGVTAKPLPPLITLKLCTLDKISLFVFPIIFFVFCITYWIYYMWERDRISKHIHKQYGFDY